LLLPNGENTKEMIGMPHLYEVLLELETDAGSFLHCEFKVFHSHAEARKWGKWLEREMNGGQPIEEKAWDGYYFKYWGARRVSKIDGFPVTLSKRTSASPNG